MIYNNKKQMCLLDKRTTCLSSKHQPSANSKPRYPHSPGPLQVIWQGRVKWRHPNGDHPWKLMEFLGDFLGFLGDFLGFPQVAGSIFPHLPKRVFLGTRSFWPTAICFDFEEMIRSWWNTYALLVFVFFSLSPGIFQTVSLSDIVICLVWGLV